MPVTEDPVVLADYIKAMLVANQLTLGLKDIWYGEQHKVPRVPCCAVETGTSTRKLAGAPFRTDINFRIHVTVYHGAIADTQVNRKACDEAARAIEALLHTDKQMGGNVIFGMCSQIEPGYAIKSGVLMHASRITWEGLSKVSI